MFCPTQYRSARGWEITPELGPYIEPVEKVVSILLVLHEELQVLEDTFLDLNSVVVADRVFAEEIKLHDKLLAVVLLVQLYVFHPQGTTTDRVRLVLVLLVASSQSQL